MPSGGRQKELSPRNMLLLTLKWLRKYPTAQDLAFEFGVTPRSIRSNVACVLDILDPRLEYLRRWPSTFRSKVLTGPLKDTIGAIDTFPICIPQPEFSQDRKRFYIYKPGHQTRYGWKVQTFVDLQGRILDITDAHPFGSKADITLFRESQIPGKLDQNTRAIAPSVDLASRIEGRLKRHKAERDKQRKKRRIQREKSESQRDDVEDDEKNDSDNSEDNPEDTEEPQAYYSVGNIGRALSKALGDKAYQGAKLCYVPYKRFKGKRFPWKKKQFNQTLSSKRVIVENVNQRLELWKVIGTIFREKSRSSKTISKIVRVVASLCNWTMERDPLRKGKRKA